MSVETLSDNPEYQISSTVQFHRWWINGNLLYYAIEMYAWYDNTLEKRPQKPTNPTQCVLYWKYTEMDRFLSFKYDDTESKIQNIFQQKIKTLCLYKPTYLRKGTH